MLKKLIVLLTIFCSTLVHADSDSNTLIIGTNTEFPPFSYIENKEIVGFDIDVAKEVAKRLDKKIQFKDMPFDALIPEIILGRVDFVAAGMSFSEERAKRVSFTRPYISEDPLVIFTNSNQKLDLEGVIGKKVIVIEGFTADLFMSSKKGIHLTRLPTQADGFMAIKSGRADAFVTAKSTVDAFFDVQDCSKFTITPINETSETCAIVVPKSKPQMLVDVQNALDSMEKDGTMAQIKAKWKLQ